MRGLPHFFQIFFFRWRSTDSKSKFFLDPSVVRSEEGASGEAVCRGYHASVLSPGHVDPASGRCLVGHGGRAHSRDAYQVMVDPTATARREWRPWDIFTRLPLGAVALLGEDGFVARYRDGNGNNGSSYHVGDLNPRRGLSGDIALYPDDRVRTVTRGGEVLVEVQPVRYRLEEVEYVTRRAKEVREAVHLGSRVLTRELDSNSYEEGGGDDWGSVRAVVAYNASYSYYWGRVARGLVKALPSTASASFRDMNKPVSFKWALPLEFTLHRILEVSAWLRPGTSVQVSATAARVTTEAPYRARLVAEFADGEEVAREVRGTYVETLLADVRTAYGRPYFTRNGTFAPTTTTTAAPAVSSTEAAPPVASGRRAPFAAPETMNPLVPATTTTLRPRRTTTPVPTEPNPLRRFYPAFEEASVDVMQSDQAGGRNNANKRSPQPDSLVNAAAAHGRVPLLVALPALAALLLRSPG